MQSPWSQAMSQAYFYKIMVGFLLHPLLPTLHDILTWIYLAFLLQEKRQKRCI